MWHAVPEGPNIAKPRITYGHGYLTDCGSGLGDWTESRTNMDAADAEMTVDNGDYFKIKAFFDDGATDEFCWYSYPTVGVLGLDSDDYDTCMFRYKTSVASAGAKAKIELVFSDASTQVVLAPSYSTTFKFGEVTVESGKQIDYVRLFADDDGTNGTFHVWYDFLLLCLGKFTFPNVSGKAEVVNRNRVATLGIPGRVTGVTQNLGAENEVVQITGDMERGSWGTPTGDYLNRIWHELHSDPWQWLQCDNPKRHYKVTPLTLTMPWESGLDGKPRYTVELQEYRLGDGSYESWHERFGTGY